jgi:hypothetical protein
MSSPQDEMNVGVQCGTKRFKKFAFLLLFCTVLITLTAATANGAGNTALPTNATAAQPLVGTTTHPIQYWIGCPPSMVDDGTSLTYFQQHGFTAVVLVVPDAKTYQTELNKIKSLNMLPILDVEMPIWNGGQLQSTPITSFGSYFQSLKNAGWQYVASEGGRTGDLAYMKNYFQGYVNFNCDQCGLWGTVYQDPFTVANSWESYYPSEVPYIQQGATQAAALGIQNGLLAGVWPNNGNDNQILANSLNGSTPSYKSMLDWSYANGIGFTSFHVWCGDNAQGLSQYKACGFESIVANLQTYYPPTSSASVGHPWSSWTSPGGQLASGTGPAACSWNSSRLDLFVQGTDGQLWWKYTTNGGGSWTSWRSLGGKLTSSPAAASPASGVIDVFVRGSDGALWQRTTTNGGASWSAWASIGGQLASGTGPAVCSQGSSLDVFVQGTDHVLYYKQWDGTTWSGWKSLGAGLTSSPGVTSQANGKIDVFVRGTDNAIWYREYSGTSWSTWHGLSGLVASGTGPAACSWGAGRLDVFVQGTDGILYQKTYAGSSWSGWQSLSGKLTSSPAATSPASGVIDVFVRGSDGAVWETSYLSSS